MNQQHDNSNQPARTPSPVDPLTDDAWQVRIGQIETVLRFFGSLCSVSIDRSAGNGSEAVTDDVYVQAQRIDNGIELEMTGPQFLSVGGVTDAQVALMSDLGWTAPDGPASPNFVRLLPVEVDVHDVAVDVVRAFAEVYDVRPDTTWVVSPPEFGNVDAGLAPFDVLDLDDEEGAASTPAEELLAARRRILRVGSGAQLLAVVERSDHVGRPCRGRPSAR